MKKGVLTTLIFLFALPIFLSAKDFFWVNPFPAENHIRSSYFLDDQNGWICGHDGFAMKTTNGGQTWKQLPTSVGGHFLDVKFINKDKGFFCGVGGRLIKTEDGGESFSWVEIDAEGDFRDIFFLDENVGYVAGASGLFKTVDGGENWELVYKANMVKIWFLDEDTGFFTSSSNFPWLFKTVDGGENWEKSLQGRWFMTVFFVDENLGWAGSDYGLSKTTDGGENWESIESIGGTPVRDIDFLDENTGIVSCYGGKSFMTNNGGGIWFEKDVKLENADLWTVSFLNENEIMIFGSLGAMGKTVDGGKKWQSLNESFYFLNKVYNHIEPEKVVYSDENTFWMTVWNEKYFGDKLSHLVKTTNHGKTWEDVEFNEESMPLDIFFFDENLGFAYGEFGDDADRYQKTTDGGVTWFDREEEIFYIDYEYLFPPIFCRGADLVFGVSKNNLYKSTDGAKSWKKIETESDDFYFDEDSDMFFVDDQTGWAITTRGDLWRTDDAGETWDMIYEDAGNAVRFFNKDEGIVFGGSEYGGDLYYTNDGGYSWAAVKQDIKGFVDLEIIEGKALVLAGEYIFSSDDNGMTWSIEYNTHSGGRDPLGLYGKSLENMTVVCSYEGILNNKASERPFELLVGIKYPDVESLKSENCLFPNPAEDFIRVLPEAVPSDLREAVVSNSIGIEIARVRAEAFLSGDYEIPLNGAPAGVYFLTLRGEKTTKTIGFVKK